MEVDQKHITTIRMHDAKGCDVRLVKDGEDYQLQLASSCNVVHIALGLADVRKLCQQLVAMDLEESYRTRTAPPPPPPLPEFRSVFFNGTARHQYDSVPHWYAHMATDTCCKR